MAKGATSSQDAAVGAIVGAFVGDAAGAVLEFAGVPDEAAVDRACGMPGGGALNVGSGQITDDSEMALCLAQGLLTSPPPDLPKEEIAKNYVRWLRSRPFDIGIATRSALSAGSSTENPSVAHAIEAAARSQNSGSKANGGLMRITPLAVWGHMLPHKELAARAAAETRLTHPNATCGDCSAAYCIAIAHLIRHPGDSTGAFSAAASWLQQARPDSEALAWLQESTTAGCPIQDRSAVSRQTIGFVRWGYTLAFHHLHRRSAYTQAIAQTLLLGGDTDTNAAIVGGMVGALWGAGSVPEDMKGPVLARRGGSGQSGHARPQFLQSGQAVELAQQLFGLGASSTMGGLLAAS